MHKPHQTKVMCIFVRIICPVNNGRAVEFINCKDFGMISCCIFVRIRGNQGQNLQKVQS